MVMRYSGDRRGGTVVVEEVVRYWQFQESS